MILSCVFFSPFWCVCCSADEDPSGAVQVADGLHRVGVQAHHAERGGDRTQRSPPPPPEVLGGPGRDPVLPDLLHRPHAAHVLSRHRLITHCQYVPHAYYLYLVALCDQTHTG